MITFSRFWVCILFHIGVVVSILFVTECIAVFKIAIWIFSWVNYFLMSWTSFVSRIQYSSSIIFIHRSIISYWVSSVFILDRHFISMLFDRLYIMGIDWIWLHIVCLSTFLHITRICRWFIGIFISNIIVNDNVRYVLWYLSTSVIMY